MPEMTPTTLTSPDPEATGIFGLELTGDQPQLELILDRLVKWHGAKMVQSGGNRTFRYPSDISTENYIVFFEVPRKQ